MSNSSNSDSIEMSNKIDKNSLPYPRPSLRNQKIREEVFDDKKQLMTHIMYLTRKNNELELINKGLWTKMNNQLQFIKEQNQIIEMFRQKFELSAKLNS